MARRTTTSPFPDRLRALRAAISDAGGDVAIVSNPTDVGYLTGFLGGDSWLVVGPSGKPLLISDRRYEEELGAFRPIVRVAMRNGSMAGAVADALAELSPAGGRGKAASKGPVLVLQSDHLTLAMDKTLRGAFRKAKVELRVKPVSGLVGELRLVKDAGEIALMRKAIRIQEAALLEVMPTIRAGETELDVRARLEAAMTSRGSATPAFETIIASKGNAALPHYRPDATKIKANQCLLIDYGATWKGYRGDITRTFTLGRWPKAVREVYEIVNEAHEAAVDVIRDGVACRDVDAAAREVIRKAGFGKAFNHSLGHGIGMDVHEMPRLSSQAGKDEVLRAGHVVTIEPGIYLPGGGGVRLEDAYAVTERGATKLSSLPRDLDWATL